MKVENLPRSDLLLSDAPHIRLKNAGKSEYDLPSPKSSQGARTVTTRLRNNYRLQRESINTRLFGECFQKFDSKVINYLRPDLSASGELLPYVFHHEKNCGHVIHWSGKFSETSKSYLSKLNSKPSNKI